MTADKVRAVLALYRKKLDELRVGQEPFSHELFPSENEALAHCRKMLDDMEPFIAQQRMDKVFRWLGFIQGCLWTTGTYTIEELKNHNKP